MSNKLEIVTDITDWRDEAMRAETIIADRESILDLVKSGKKLPEVARATIVNRELGNCPTEILKPNKLLLMFGAEAEIAQMAASEMTKVTAPNGAEYNARALIGSVPEQQESVEPSAEPEQPERETGYIDIKSPEARKRAVDYMERIIPGHVWSRLLIVMTSGGDVRQEADKLKAAIDEMVKRLV